MVVAIKSDYRRITQRHAIRQSWGAIKYLDGVRLQVLYVVAEPDTKESRSTLASENELFGDILMVKMNETYP